MKKLNEKGLSIIEIIVTFSLIIFIVTGLLGIIMNYRSKMQIELKRLDLISFKNSLTKDIQNDIIDRGLADVIGEDVCMTTSGYRDKYSSCIILKFKDGVEKMLATSKTNFTKEEIENNKTLVMTYLNSKFIQYGDNKYLIEDKLPDNIPNGRNIMDFQNMFMTNNNFFIADSAILADGTVIKIYSIDIFIEHIDYSDDFGIHIVATNNDTMTANALVQEFEYTGAPQEFTAPANGTYKIEAWGASGGDIDAFTGGLGAYAGGYVTLKKGTKLYVYVGQAGTSGTDAVSFNGSGLGTGQNAYGSNGGGASDVRTVGGVWTSLDSLKSRILVAAGGGGANNRNTTSSTERILYGAGNGGAGGALTGYDGDSVNNSASNGYSSNNSYYKGLGGTQTLAGAMVNYNADGTQLSSEINGTFGVADSSSQSGGGGGWYPGGGSANGGAGGGSSFISGHNGCFGVVDKPDGTFGPSGTSEVEGYHFSNTVIIDGEGFRWTNVQVGQQEMPSYPGKTGEVGNKGNGHVTISYLGV